MDTSALMCLLTIFGMLFAYKVGRYVGENKAWTKALEYLEYLDRKEKSKRRDA